MLASLRSHHGAPALRLFLDSADPADWEKLLPTGIFHGVTTNPLLLEKSGLPCTHGQLESLVQVAARLPIQEIHLQTWGKTAAEMIDNGRGLARLARPGLAVALKVPVTATGLAVARELRATDCPLTLTAVYDPAQVLLAAGFQAAYAAPYLGRIQDRSGDGLAKLAAMKEILSAAGGQTRLLVASLRTADDVVRLAAAGFDTLTFGSEVASTLLSNPDTDLAARDFQRAAEQAGGE